MIRRISLFLLIFRAIGYPQDSHGVRHDYWRKTERCQEVSGYSFPPLAFSSHESQPLLFLCNAADG